MSLARSACAPQLFSQPVGSADPEFARVLRTADPGPALDGPLTFLPDAGASPADWLRAWNEWRQNILSRSLAPVLLQTTSLAARGCAREMLALDRELDASLDPAARERSTAAGRRLLVRLASSRGERWLGRFQQWTVAGESPGHFPVIYAGQHALFHLPLRLLIPAYAYWEWSAAMSARPAAGGTIPDFASEADGLSRLAQDILPTLPSPYAVENLPAASSDR